MSHHFHGQTPFCMYQSSASASELTATWSNHRLTPGMAPACISKTSCTSYAPRLAAQPGARGIQHRCRPPGATAVLAPACPRGLYCESRHRHRAALVSSCMQFYAAAASKCGRPKVVCTATSDSSTAGQTAASAATSSVAKAPAVSAAKKELWPDPWLLPFRGQTSGGHTSNGTGAADQASSNIASGRENSDVSRNNGADNSSKSGTHSRSSSKVDRPASEQKVDNGVQVDFKHNSSNGGTTAADSTGEVSGKHANSGSAGDVAGRSSSSSGKTTGGLTSDTSSTSSNASVTQGSSKPGVASANSSTSSSDSSTQGSSEPGDKPVNSSKVKTADTIGMRLSDSFTSSSNDGTKRSSSNLGDASVVSSNVVTAGSGDSTKDNNYKVMATSTDGSNTDSNIAALPADSGLVTGNGSTTSGKDIAHHASTGNIVASGNRPSNTNANPRVNGSLRIKPLTSSRDLEVGSSSRFDSAQDINRKVEVTSSDASNKDSNIASWPVDSGIPTHIGSTSSGKEIPRRAASSSSVSGNKPSNTSASSRVPGTRDKPLTSSNRDWLEPGGSLAHAVSPLVSSNTTGPQVSIRPPSAGNSSSSSSLTFPSRDRGNKISTSEDAAIPVFVKMLQSVPPPNNLVGDRTPILDGNSSVVTSNIMSTGAKGNIPALVEMLQSVSHPDNVGGGYKPILDSLPSAVTSDKMSPGATSFNSIRRSPISSLVTSSSCSSSGGSSDDSSGSNSGSTANSFRGIISGSSSTTNSSSNNSTTKSHPNLSGSSSSGSSSGRFEAMDSESSAEASRDWVAELDELMKLVALLPPPVRQILEMHPNLSELLEVVMDLGRPPLARFPQGDEKLSSAPVSAADLAYAIQQIGEFGGDNRAGIDRTLHRISCMRNRQGKVVGLTCRAGRAIRGSARMVQDIVMSGASVLFMGRPGVGKTTAIREVCRMFAEDLRKRVVIVDTSNEIGGDGDIAHSGIGKARRMQVGNPDEQHKVMIEAVENHTPEVIVIDEISTEAECLAARTIAQRGVQLVATAHGIEMINLIKNPSLADLVGGIQSVTLGDEEAKRRGGQKSILERGGPPTFDVAVEMLERHKWRLHLDVGQTVDILLSGGEAGGQVRERAADGSILKYQFNPIVSSALKRSAKDGSAKKLLEGAASPSEAYLHRPAMLGQSTFVRDPEEFLSLSSQVDDEDDGGDDFGGSRMRKIKSRQAIAGVTADSPQVVLRVFPYELTDEKLWEVMSAMGLATQVFVASRLSEADAVLALRSKVKSNAALRAAATAAGIPVYAVKNSAGPTLVKAFRTLLGADAAAGGVLDRDEPSQRQLQQPPPGLLLQSRRASSDDSDSSSWSADDVLSARMPTTGRGFGRRPASPFSALAAAAERQLPATPTAEAEGLEEARLAVERIVLPLRQPVELLPRAEPVLQAQIQLLKRRQLGYELLDNGGDVRIRILPFPPHGTQSRSAVGL